MNWPLLCRLLGFLGMLVGGSMTLSLPWAFPACGQVEEFETAGFRGLAAAIVTSLIVGGGLWWVGRNAGKDTILRKEALAVVGLGWILAGVLGALPLYLSGSYRQYFPDAPDRRTSPSPWRTHVFESVSGFSTTGASGAGRTGGFPGRPPLRDVLAELHPLAGRDGHHRACSWRSWASSGPGGRR